MSSDRILRGIFAPLTTPFRGDAVDLDAFAANLRHYATTPLSGAVVLGSNGEAPLLDDDESDHLIEMARVVWPERKWLIAGTGRESTKATIAATRRAAERGVDAVMVRTPSFYKRSMTGEAFTTFYRAVADASPVPVILYNVTIFTGVNLATEVAATLSSHENIIGIKDSGGDVTVIADLVARLPPGFRRAGRIHQRAVRVAGRSARRARRLVRRTWRRRSARRCRRPSMRAATTRRACCRRG